MAVQPEERLGYPAWVNRVTKALLANEDWTTALRGEWRNAFESRGFTPADLHAALDAILREGEVPNTGRELFASLRARAAVAQRSRLAILSRSSSPEDYSVCEACGNSGQVEVPVLRISVPGSEPLDLVSFDGEWRPYRWNRHGEPIFATGSVVCRCNPGKKIRAAQKSDSRQMWIEDYEKYNPFWKKHIAKRNAGRRAELGAEVDERPVKDIASGIGEMPNV